MVALPEFFTTGIALHPIKLVNAYRPLEGGPMQLLKKLAHEGGAYVAGSFLARSGADVFNTFVLASPSGEVYTHDKDFPTTDVENNSVYAGGEDDEFVKELSRHTTVASKQPIPSRPGNIKSAVFNLPSGISTGAALCWEQCRYRTARRLTGRVDLILAASGWPLFRQRYLTHESPARARVVRRNEGIQGGARRLARLVGAPVVHASLVGETWNSAGSALPDGVLRFSGESQITDAHRGEIARRSYAEGEGLVIAEIETGRVEPSEQIPADAFWTPEASGAEQLWAVSGALGREVYLSTTRPHRNS